MSSRSPSETPAFFVPNIKPEHLEAAYAELARVAGRQVPPLEARIYSIDFNHDGEAWTARVGSQLSGHTIADPNARAKSRRIERRVGDAATVQAIFAGVPYMVVTDGLPLMNVRSQWVNPFLAGVPSLVTYFGGRTIAPSRWP